MIRGSSSVLISSKVDNFVTVHSNFKENEKRVAQVFVTEGFGNREGNPGDAEFSMKVLTWNVRGLGLWAKLSSRNKKRRNFHSFV